MNYEVRVYLLLVLAVLCSFYMCFEIDMFIERITNEFFADSMIMYVAGIYKDRMFDSLSRSVELENFVYNECLQSNSDSEKHEKSEGTKNSLYRQNVIVKEKRSLARNISSDGEVFWKGVLNRFDVPLNPKVVVFGAFGLSVSSIVFHSKIIDPSKLTLVDDRKIPDSLDELIIDCEVLLPDSKGDDINSLKLHEAVLGADIVINGIGFFEKNADGQNNLPLSGKISPVLFKDNAIVIDLVADAKRSILSEQAKISSRSVRFENGFPFMVDLNSAAMDFIMSMTEKSARNTRFYGFAQ